MTRTVVLCTERKEMNGVLGAAILGPRAKRCAASEPSSGSTGNPQSTCESDDANLRECGERYIIVTSLMGLRTFHQRRN